MAVRMRFKALILILIPALLLPVISSRWSVMGRDKSLQDGARLHILANVVRPIEATCEQYPYFDYPFCPPGGMNGFPFTAFGIVDTMPEPIKNRTRSFKDLLAGDCFTNTQYELRFKNNTERKILCEKSLTKDEVAKFRDAIKRKFVFSLAYHKSILRGVMGRIEEEKGPKYYLATHLSFNIKYYKNRVVEVILMRDPETDVDITKVAKIKVNFTYSVLWEKANLSELPFYEENEIIPGDDRNWTSSLIRWAGAALLWGLTLLIVTLPYLLNYFSRCRVQFDPDIPQYPSLLAAILGTGAQFLLMGCMLFVLPYKGSLYPCHIESLCSQILQAYFLSSFLSGYNATSFHSRFAESGWKECVFQAATIYFIPALLTTVFTNGLAVTKSGIPSVPELGVIFEELLFWQPSSVVALTLGTALTRSLGLDSRRTLANATGRAQREIPPESWYMKTPIQMLLGAFIPCAVMFPEMDNIYASLWNLKLCGAYHTLLNSFAVAIALTVVVSIAFTAAKHDQKWWWRSVFRGGSPAIFVFGYGIYFFLRIDIDEGLMIRIVGYNACFSYALFLMLGATSYYASSCIVRLTDDFLKSE